jgi:hypothetical protein
VKFRCESRYHSGFLPPSLPEASRFLLFWPLTSDFRPLLSTFCFQLLAPTTSDFRFFIIEGDEKSTHILNAVSPGWTCAIPFASHVVDLIEKNFSSSPS